MSDNTPQVKSLLTAVPTPFPSRTLVVLSIISCFIATAAFVSSFTQVASRIAYFIVPSFIGFLATIVYHVCLYLIWQKRRESLDHSASVFITSTWIFLGFLLIPLWVVIFYINILFIVGEGPHIGIILTMIWSALEWIVLLCMVLNYLYDVEHIGGSPLLAESLSQGVGVSGSDVTLSKLDATVNTMRPRHLYFVSTVLCTLTLMFSIDDGFPVWPLNVLAFLLTAPHHIALFITLGRPQFPIPIFSRPTSIWYSIALVTFWCCVLPFNILASRLGYQSLLLGIFGGAECVILGYFAIPQHVLNELWERLEEGRIRL